MSSYTDNSDDHLLTAKFRSACLVALRVDRRGMCIGCRLCAGGFLARLSSRSHILAGRSAGWIGDCAHSSSHRRPLGLGTGGTLHALVGTITVGVLGLLPLAIGASAVYPWANDSEASAALNPHQQVYLAPTWVLARTGFEVLAWLGTGAWLMAGYARMARSRRATAVAHRSGAAADRLFPDRDVRQRRRADVADAGMDVIDIRRALGGRFWAGRPVAAHPNASVAIARQTALGNPPTDDTRNVTHDLGNFLLAFNLMWAYLAFSQYLIMWSGDLPREVSWYVARSAGWPGIASIVLIVFHFAVPLVMLLSREQKRDNRRLAQVAVLLLAMHVCDIIWTVMPAYSHIGLLVVPMFFASWCAIGSVWLLAFDRIWMRLPEPSLRVAANGQLHPASQTDAAAQ